jgi:hypothetical protein
VLNENNLEGVEYFQKGEIDFSIKNIKYIPEEKRLLYNI